MKLKLVATKTIMSVEQMDAIIFSPDTNVVLFRRLRHSGGVLSSAHLESPTLGRMCVDCEGIWSSKLWDQFETDKPWLLARIRDGRKRGAIEDADLLRVD